MMSQTNFNEQLNRLINRALADTGSSLGSAGAMTSAWIGGALTAAGTAVTALSGVTHSREIQDPGPTLNPNLPNNP